MKFTLFPDKFSRALLRCDMPWHAFVRDIQHNSPEYKSKHNCPLISLTEYGEDMSMNGSFRHIANAMAVHGIEGDYDGGRVSPLFAYLKALNHGIKAVVVTTPSHTPTNQRWRIFLPLSAPIDISDRRHMVERLNGLYEGILAPESATATQCFYIGKVLSTAAHYQVFESFGRCIDQVNDLPSIPMAITERADSLNISDSAWKSLSRDEQYEIVHAAFTNKDGRHEAARRLAVMMAQDGADVQTIRDELTALFGDDHMSADGKRDLLRDIKTFPEWAVRTIGAPKADALKRADASLNGLLKAKK
jgi:hypothetical protein